MSETHVFANHLQLVCCTSTRVHIHHVTELAMYTKADMNLFTIIMIVL